MELLYFWIANSRNLNHIGFNLSNKDRFKYDPERKTLTVVPASNYIKEFFGPNITHVTGIFGENGAGKTNTLRRLMEALVTGGNEKIKEAVIVFGDDQGYHLYAPGIGEIIYDQTIFKLSTDIRRFRSAFTFVFFSNHFDAFNLQIGDSTSTQLAGLENISTNYLLGHDIIGRENKDSSFRMPLGQALLNHNKSEFNRQVRLFRKYKTQQLLVRIPNYLVLSISGIDEEQLLERSDFFINDFGLMEARLGKQNILRFLFYLFKALVLNLINQSNFTYGINQDAGLTAIIENLHYLAGIDEPFSLELADIFVGRIKSSPDQNVSILFGEKLEHLLRTLRGVRKLIKSEQRLSYNAKDFYLNIHSDSAKILDDFMEHYFNNVSITQALDFRFSHDRFAMSALSSGESALLGMFARLNALLVKDLKRNLILLLDEAELSLHPHWQVCFLKTLLDFMVKEFRNKKIQLVLTSHSPFIISDLPNNCIILLEKEDDRVWVKERLKHNEQTFGANIHHLFLESFFMKDSLMGEFARGKIGELADEIFQKKSITETEYAYYRMRAEMIGEPFIRLKLIEKLISLSPLSDIDKLIAQKNLELQQLISKKNDQNRP